MLKSITVTAAAVALALAALLLLPRRGQEAAAQAAPRYIYLVDLDIVPSEFDKFMEALKENAAASMQDPGCREFDIGLSQKDPHHVLLFEVYDDIAALRAHEATAHFKKYSEVTGNMVIERRTRGFSSVAMNIKSR